MENLNFIDIAAIFPIGILATAIPIGPAGVGVGHLAFANLFGIFDLSTKIGVNTYNLYCFGFIFCFLFGSIPFLLAKKLS